MKSKISKFINCFLVICFILQFGSLSMATEKVTNDNSVIPLIEPRGVSVSLDEIVNREYYIKNVYSGKYLDVSGATAADGTNVQQYEFNGTDAQRWAILRKEGSNNEVNIASRVGNDGTYYKYVLDINGGGSSDGTNAQIYHFLNSDGQTFKIDYNIEFCFAIKTKCSGYSSCITLSSNNFNNEHNVNQAGFTSNGTQAWILEPVEKYRDFGKKYALANYQNYIMTYPNCKAENMGGDCTNFVSQCMNAEGFHFNGNWYMYKKNTTFEAPTNVASFRFSWDTGDPAPWINANDFKKHWGTANNINKGLAFFAYYVDSNFSDVKSQVNLQVGDVIQMAYRNNNTFGDSHHSMIVTSITSNDYLLSGHSDSACNKSIREIARAYPNEVFIFYDFK